MLSGPVPKTFVERLVWLGHPAGVVVIVFM